MKVLRNVLSVLLVISLLFTVVACGNSDPPDPISSDDDVTFTGVLYADFSCAATSTDEELIREYPFEYSTRQMTAEEFAGELSVLTGLDFYISVTEVEDGLVVDWASNSTLVAGLDDREQYEDFFFYDHHSLCWFMMDSLWRTLSDNLEVENIYYTMNNGEKLMFEELSPVKEFPSDVPYMGSVFYAAHSDVRGDEEALERTKGVWRLDGSLDTAFIEMDGVGNFTMYYADGAVEAEGTLFCEDEYGEGVFRYDMLVDGEKLCEFFFDSDTQFHIGNAAMQIYMLEQPTNGLLGEWIHSDSDYSLYFTNEEFTWQMDDDIFTGLYGLDGDTLTLYSDEEGYTQARFDEAEGRIYVEGDAGSFYYRAEG